jgi:hypothetical protein
MKPVKFPEVNCELAKDQPEYEPLPVFYNAESPAKEMTACFQLSDEEVAEIVRTRKIWHTQLTLGNPFQPIYLSTQSPFIEEASQHPDVEKLPSMKGI